MLLTEVEEIKGKTLEEVEQMPKYANYKIRVIEENGVAKNITTETNGKRINVGINKGTIIEIVGIY